MLPFNWFGSEPADFASVEADHKPISQKPSSLAKFIIAQASSRPVPVESILPPVKRTSDPVKMLKLIADILLGLLLIGVDQLDDNAADGVGIHVVVLAGVFFADISPGSGLPYVIAELFIVGYCLA